MTKKKYQAPTFRPATPEEIEAFARISEADKHRAKDAFRRDAPKRFKSLLDAEQAKPGGRVKGYIELDEGVYLGSFDDMPDEPKDV